MKRGFAAIALLAGVLMEVEPGSAHKGITSKFTYNADVYPIFLNRCGACHIEGGVGPMSLLKYEEAFPWAEALRTELLAAAAGGEQDYVKAAHRQISARELDVILDWATGGTPQGDSASAPPPPQIRREWAGKLPDLVVTMAEPFELAAADMESTQELLLPLPITEPRALREFDVLPGTPAIVRSVAVSIKAKDGTLRTLGTWFPRQSPVALSIQPPARIEPGAELVARVHYKKTWKLEGEPASDRSSIGFHFAD